jgi:hypothetical protein
MVTCGGNKRRQVDFYAYWVNAAINAWLVGATTNYRWRLSAQVRRWSRTVDKRLGTTMLRIDAASGTLQ